MNLLFTGQNSYSEVKDTQLNDNEHRQQYRIIFLCYHKHQNPKHRSLLQQISLYVTSNFQGFLVALNCHNFVNCKTISLPICSK